MHKLIVAGYGRSRKIALSRKLLVGLLLACILLLNTIAMAQRTRRGSAGALEAPPPRQEAGVNPWPWFLAFILLGLAWYPAFKNAKRESGN